LVLRFDIDPDLIPVQRSPEQEWCLKQDIMDESRFSTI
jgi:hypothetical protein